MSSRPSRLTMSPGAASTAAVSVTARGKASPWARAAVNSSAQALALSPRAAATTVAPCAARRAAIARPMPREAPVTRATLTARLSMNQGFNRREIVRAAEVDDGGLTMNLADQPAQHGARAHFNIRCDAFRRKAPHHGLPAHPRRDLLHQRLDRRRRVAFRLGVDVGDDRHARRLDAQRAQFGRETLLRRLH